MSVIQSRTQLEQFSNSCAVFSFVRGGFFLREKPHIILLPVYSNWRTAVARLASVWLFSPVILFAQSAGTSIANPAPAGQMQALEQRIDKLAENLTAAQRQVEEDRLKMQSMQAELDDLRKTVAAGSRDSAERGQCRRGRSAAAIRGADSRRTGGSLLRGRTARADQTGERIEASGAIFRHGSLQRICE
jgi:hypothetical protein